VRDREMCQLSGSQLHALRIVDETVEERLAPDRLAAYRAARARLDAFDQQARRLLQIPMPLDALRARTRAYWMDRDRLVSALADIIVLARPPALLIEPPTR
jgi:hypothetical protein